MATDPVEVDAAVEEMIINRIIDNAAVSAASVARRPVTVAREQAAAHPTPGCAAVFGIPGTYSAEWAAWANGVAVRELDFHDTFLAADYSHPGDNSPATVAAIQTKKLHGRDVIRELATAYEIQVDLVRCICLHDHKIDHVAHLGPSVAAGLGHCWVSIATPFIKRLARRFTPPQQPVSPAKATSLRGKPLRPLSPENGN